MWWRRQSSLDQRPVFSASQMFSSLLFSSRPSSRLQVQSVPHCSSSSSIRGLHILNARHSQSVRDLGYQGIFCTGSRTWRARQASSFAKPDSSISHFSFELLSTLQLHVVPHFCSSSLKGGLFDSSSMHSSVVRDFSTQGRRSLGSGQMGLAWGKAVTRARLLARIIADFKVEYS